MKFYLWIDGKQDGPHEPEQIRDMLEKGNVANVTLAQPEDGASDWVPISNFTNFIYPPKQPEPQQPASAPEPTSVSEFKLPPIEDSGAAVALTVIGTLELIASPFAGSAIGSDNELMGWAVFISGVISGLILIGFARIIENTSKSSQRLQRIEMLIQKHQDDEKVKEIGKLEADIKKLRENISK